tara:strand:+ start:75 stop:1136 length:1062 start_codon:yes stop_codon:yes gene_type:complete
MSYLGRGLEQVDNISKLDNITFNGGTTYALTKDSAAFTPISSNAILISIDGVIQQGNFSVSGTNIVFNFSPTSSNTCNWILHMGTGVAFTPADSSVTKDKANFISTSSAAGLQIKGDGTTDGTLQLNCSQNSHGVKIKSPAHSAGQSYTLTLPTTAPASNKMLQTDGSGNLSFVDAPSGGLVPTGQVDSGGNVGAVVLNDIFTSTYTNYIVIVDKCIPASGGASMYMQFRDESGGLGGSDYGYSNRALLASNGSEDNSDGDGQTQVKFASGGIGNLSNKLGMRMVIHVQDPYTSSVYTGFHGTYGYINNSGYAVHGYLGGLYAQNDSIRGLQLYLNTGGNLNARIKAYGIVDS